jgi:hypothetical protein
VITEIPIPWSPQPDPFTLAGDEAWTDYSVAADVHFLSKGPALVIGRIDSSNVFDDGKARWPGGYVFRVKPDGGWDLLSTEYKKPVATLASGSTVLERSSWHRLELRFHGTQISASIDGKPVSTVENTAHAHGMFALGTEWDHVQFDNLRVQE